MSWRIRSIGLDLTAYEGISAGGNNCGTSILTGDKLVGIIIIASFDACSSPIGFPSMDERIGGALDSSEIAMIQTWVDSDVPYDCSLRCSIELVISNGRKL